MKIRMVRASVFLTVLFAVLVVSQQNCAPAKDASSGAASSAGQEEDYDFTPAGWTPTPSSVVSGKPSFESDANFRAAPTEAGDYMGAHYGAYWTGLVASPEQRGDAGANEIAGGPDANTIFGLEGDDIIFGNQGNDTLYGNQGNDTIYGGQNHDLVYGGQDNDTIYGGLGQDRLEGNLGDDTIYGDDDNDTLLGHNGNDTINGNIGNDLLFGGPGNDILYGGKDHDLLFGGQGDDTLAGGLGHDVLDGNRGTNRLSGGDGNDVYIYSSVSSGIEIFDETSGVDTLVCLDIQASTYQIVNDQLQLNFSNGTRVTVLNYGNPLARIERFVNCGQPTEI